MEPVLRGCMSIFLSARRRIFGTPTPAAQVTAEPVASCSEDVVVFATGNDYEATDGPVDERIQDDDPEETEEEDEWPEEEDEEEDEQEAEMEDEEQDEQEMEDDEDEEAGDPHRFKEAIGNIVPGAKGFIDVFKKFRNEYFTNPGVIFRVLDTGHDLPEDLSTIDNIYLIKNKDGLEMTVPDITFRNIVPDYLTKTTKLKVINCNTQKAKRMKIVDFLKAVNNKKSKQRYNILSLEMSMWERASRAFQPPAVVRNLSLVDKLDEVLKRMKEDLEKNGTTSRGGEAKERLQKQIDGLPRLEKFLLLSMKDSFTDVHVDMAATAVFYHVIVGKKIFFIAPPTKKNLDTFIAFEKGKQSDTWLGYTMFEEFRVLEIEEGNTAMIPAGYIHYVYTPVHSIVFGGNFLSEKAADLQFKFATVERDLVKTGVLKADQAYQNFPSLMFAYCDHCLIPNIESGKTSEADGKRMLNGLERLLNHDGRHNLKGPEKSWYTADEEERIVERLNNALRGASSRAKRAAEKRRGESVVAKKKSRSSI